MYRTILVPLDGSKRAEAILPHVENLANCFGAKVVLLQVAEPHAILIDGVNPVPDMEEHERLTRAATAYLAHLTGQLREKGIEVKAQVAHGPVAKEIIKAAQFEQADLIAMASHGRTGLAQVRFMAVWPPGYCT